MKQRMSKKLVLRRYQELRFLCDDKTAEQRIGRMILDYYGIWKWTKKGAKT